MLNLFSYVGMSLQSELCLWTLLGLVRTIFDATLFKVNANLKQVWQMNMPAELSMPVQRVLRMIISGVMLVQCFTVYVYLAAYIVLLYPIFLEERPTLVLPWLLLAAVRRLLCELTSLAVGLGACVLLGPGRPPCVRFLVFKVVAIIPGFYMWMLVFSYYSTLKVATAFKLSPAAIPSDDPDYGLELAVRRRRTKSMLREDQLRRKFVASFNYGERYTLPNLTTPLATVLAKDSLSEEENLQHDLKGGDTDPLLITSERVFSNFQSIEDWHGNEITLPRDADRILEQFVVMLFRISAFLKTGASDPATIFASTVSVPITSLELQSSIVEEPSLLVGDSRVKKSPSYLQDYPQIFNKKQSSTDQKLGQNQNQTDFSDTSVGTILKDESKTDKRLGKKLSMPVKIDEMNEKNLEDRQTSAIRYNDEACCSQNNKVKYSNTSLNKENIPKQQGPNTKNNAETDENIKDDIKTLKEGSLQSINDKMKTSDNDEATSSQKNTDKYSNSNESSNKENSPKRQDPNRKDNAETDENIKDDTRTSKDEKK